MLTLEEVKNWLRLELDENHEDGQLQLLTSAAEKKLKKALDYPVEQASDQAKFYMLASIHDWYFRTDDFEQTRRTLISQLQHSIPEDNEGGGT